MFRKSIFWGLTLMLGTVLVWLIIQGRKEETRLAAAPSEIVKTAKSSFTRVIAPSDLDAEESRLEITTKTPAPGAVGQVVIHNRGKVAYHGVMLKVSCLGSGGKLLDTRTQLVPETIAAGQTLTVGGIVLDTGPRGTVRCSVSILYSDLGPAPRAE